MIPLSEVPTVELVSFFAAHPEEAYTFFNPHAFDAKTPKKLQQNHSFLAYILLEDGIIAAYCFVMSFFVGKGFRGRMVGMGFRGRGYEQADERYRLWHRPSTF